MTATHPNLIEADGLCMHYQLGSLSSDGLADLRRERVGIVFQSFHLLHRLSALDNAALPLQMAGASGAFCWWRLARWWWPRCCAR